jgi:hypothetical protein
VTGYQLAFTWRSPLTVDLTLTVAQNTIDKLFAAAHEEDRRCRDQGGATRLTFYYKKLPGLPRYRPALRCTAISPV